MKNYLKRFVTAAICSALLVSALSGCDSQPGANDLMEGISQDNIKDTASSPITDEKPQFSEGQISSDRGVLSHDASLPTASIVTYTDFAVRLFQKSLESEKNTLISPLSVINALAMTANGAKGETLSQMEQVFGADISSLNEYLHNYNTSLPSAEKYRLHIANSIWLKDKEGFAVEESFLQANGSMYGADIYKASFDNFTLKEINQWVAEHTDDMIPEILNEIPPDAVMYLINALGFDAEWQTPYKSYEVSDGIFTTESGIEKSVQMMHSEEDVLLQDVNENGETSALGFLKYYADGKYAFAALLPEEHISMKDYVNSLSGEHLSNMLSDTIDADIRASLPKFEAEYSVEMKNVLKSMGMTTAFDSGQADFSGIGFSSDGNLYISDVIHKTFIAVDEQGTKAGAATLVEVCSESASIDIAEPIYITLDRPFLYMIIDCKESLPVFIGTVMEP